MPRVALAQINPTVGDLKGNAERILSYVNLAQEKDADLVVFPEMVLCGYPPEDLLLKEHFIKDNLLALHALAKKIKKIIVIVGFVDRGKDRKVYNAAAVIAKGRIVGVYHKHELPNYGVFDEKRYFSSGKGRGVFHLCNRKMGISICEDMWVKDGVCQEQIRSHAKLLINLSGSPYDLQKGKEREKIIRQLAKKSKAYFCYTNLVGGQDELVFDGNSLIVDPQGKIIASAESFREELLVADLDLKFQRKKRKKFIETRRAKKTSRNESVLRALVLGTKDYIRKNGFQKVVIGLSGGIDSSMVAVIARMAVGKENVVGVSMPSQFSSIGTRTDAKRLAKNLGISYKEIPIRDVYRAYNKVLEKIFLNMKIDITEENIQARIRGNLLMALSNKFGWLVLTTGNKSEVAVGYCTLYGDMSGGFAVLKDVPKTTVYDLADFINREMGVLIPKSVIKRAPTAELRKNQKDQDSLPPYTVLDNFLEDYVNHHRSLNSLEKGISKAEAKRMIFMIDHNEYKRRQSPPGIKITSRAFGKDWRLPITNKYKEF